MAKIRVLLTNLPDMLADIISGIVASDADLLIVGRVKGVFEASALVEAVHEADPDIIITGPGDGTAGLDPVRLLFAVRPAKVLRILENGRRGLLYELRPNCIALGELSTASLMAAIRSAEDVHGICR